MEAIATSDVPVSDGQWHAARIDKRGSVMMLIVDEREGQEVIAPNMLRTNTVLYIGGLPGNLHTSGYSLSAWL